MCKVLTLITVEQSVFHNESLSGAASSPTEVSNRVRTYQYQSIVNKITLLHLTHMYHHTYM
jgi:hypothetical protein